MLRTALASRPYSRGEAQQEPVNSWIPASSAESIQALQVDRSEARYPCDNGGRHELDAAVGARRRGIKNSSTASIDSYDSGYEHSPERWLQVQRMVEEEDQCGMHARSAMLFRFET